MMSALTWSTLTRRCEPIVGWPAVTLGTDSYGTWLGARAGTTRYLTDQREEVQADDAVWLIDPQEWCLTTCSFSQTLDLTVDICSPPVLRGQTWSFVKVGLSLLRRPDGTTESSDRAGFDRLVKAGLLNENEKLTALSTARRLLPQLGASVEPYGQAGRPWLGVLRQRAIAPNQE